METGETAENTNNCIGGFKLKLTIGKIIGMEDGLKRLSSCRWLNAREAYAIAKLIQKLQPDIDFYHLHRNALIQKEFGIRDERDPNLYSVPKEKQAEFFDRLKEYTDIENDYDIKPVHLRGDVETGLSPADLIALDGLVVIEDA